MPTPAVIESVVQVSPSSVRVTWTEPDTGTGYFDVTCGTSEGSPFGSANIAGASASPGILTGLTPGTEYFFAVWWHPDGDTAPGPSNVVGFTPRDDLTVPSVIGLGQLAADTAIITAGLIVGTITGAYSSTVALGSVISQTPAGSSSAAGGSAVDLVISLGVQPPPPPPPPIVRSIQAELGAAWNQLQSLFGRVATINGLTVPVTSGAAVLLGEEYGPGGPNETQAVQIYSQIAGGPIPEIGMHIDFQDKTYRIEIIRELTVTWEIAAVQVIK